MSERPDILTSPPAQERRRSVRTPLIVLRLRVKEDRQTFFGYAKNISRGGLFISATSPKELGSRFNLEIPLPKPLDRTVRSTCEVVWRRPWSKGSTLEPGMGMRFLDLPAEEGETINRWIEESWRREKKRQGR